MAEYIDREEAISNLMQMVVLHSTDKFKGQLLPYIGIKAMLEYIPPANVQPVKHGKWIQDEHTYSGSWTYNFVCSSCGEIGGTWLRNIRQDQMFPFCPFCGAKMDGEA